ncbi:MAG: hypothetical protein RJA44_265 [Pseudomonadota bacterium]
MRLRPTLHWLLLWCGGWVLVTLLAWQRQHDNRIEAEAAFDRQVEQVRRDIERRMENYEHGLRGARGAVIGAGGAAIDRLRFRQYSRSRLFENEFPGARGFGFIRRVPVDQEAAFLASARREGRPDFRILQLQPHAEERLVIQYIEPEADNLPAVGLDVASESNRRTAAYQAIGSGQARLTGPITLVQAGGQPQPSVLFMLPIYPEGELPATPVERLEKVIGLSYAPLELSSVLRGLETAEGGHALWLDDRADGGELRPLYVSLHAADPDEPLRRTRLLTLYGRVWQLTLQAQPAFHRTLNQFNPGVLWVLLMAFQTAALMALALVRQRNEGTRQLRRQQARMAAIVDSSTDAMIVQRLDGCITDWNPGAERMLGYTAAEAIGRRMVDLVIPEHYHAQEALVLARSMQGVATPALDKVHRHKDGHEIPVTVSVVPMRDDGGQIIGVARVVRDISERKTAEARIVELNRLLEQRVRDQGAQLELVSAREQLLINNALSSIIVTDAQGRILLFNAAAEQLLGYSADEVVGHAVMEQFHDPEEVRARVRALSRRLGRKLAPGEIFLPDARSVAGDNNEWLYVHRDGRRIPVLLTVGALRGESGVLRGFIGIAADLSERKQLEEELRKASEMALRTTRAEAANEAKSLFLAHMSHEIRTPLNAVVALTYLLLRSRLDSDQRDLVEKTRLAGLSLLGIVNDVLDLSKIEAGEMALEQQPFSLRHMLQHVHVVVDAEARRKGLALQQELPADLPDALIGDPLRLRQVLTNLLSNAIKFTEVGQVTLRLRWAPAGDDAVPQVRLRIAVRDTGIGIDAEARARLFQPFTQADASITRRYGGTGLGLSIARRLVELMGGELQVESEPGAGSEFSFSLVLQLADAEARARLRHEALLVRRIPEGQRLRGVRVLLVDDSSINREAGRRVLELDGAQVHCASHGAEALQFLADPAHQVDVVLMDVQMPVLDGYAATRRIREQLGLQTLPVIALTAQALQSEQERARVAGMNDFLLKPIDPEQVVRTVMRHVRLPVDVAGLSLDSAPAPLLDETPPAPLQVPPEWPRIDGLDVEASAQRLYGDVTLLARLLQRFVDAGERLLVQLEQPPQPAEAAARQGLARQLHKLRGSASLLGMNALAATAEAAERALQGVETEDGAEYRATIPAEPLLLQLASRLQALLVALRPWLAERPVAPEPGSSSALPPGLLDELLQLLGAQDFGALRLYTRWQSALAAQLLPDAATRLARAMQQLDLPVAIEVLQQLRQQHGGASPAVPDAAGAVDKSAALTD